MMKLLTATFLTFLVSLSACDDDEKRSTDKITVLQKLLDDATVTHKLPGIILFVKTPDEEIAVASGEADMSTHEKMGASFLSYPQSISKTFTAVAILKLQEQGKLDVDDLMSLYLPADISENITNGNTITVRQLLNHTSGIRNYVTHEDFMNAVEDGSIFPITSEKILTYVKNQPADFAPGTGFGYSDSNYHLLALIIDAVTGKHHGEYFQTEITNKLGLKHTYYLPMAPVIPGTEQQSKYYAFDDASGVYGDVSEMQFMLTQGGIGDDGLFLRASDLAVFHDALLGKKAVLSDASLNEMMTFGFPGVQYGMGLYRITIPGTGDFWGHDGAGLGAGAHAWYSIDRNLSVVLMTNTGTLLSVDKQKVFEELLVEVLVASAK